MFSDAVSHRKNFDLENQANKIGQKCPFLNKAISRLVRQNFQDEKESLLNPQMQGAALQKVIDGNDLKNLI
jgi:hypothetical protein